MPTLAPDHTPSDVAYASRQGQPAAVSPALTHQLSLSVLLTEFAALKTRLAAQDTEITALKSKLTARDAENASLKSVIPQSAVSSPQSEISNLKSEIPNPASPAPDPIAAAFAPLFDNPVEHYIPGGSHTMPIIPREARTNQAGLERLKYLASRAELVLVEHVDRFAVCGIIGSAGQAAYEFITRNLWRLTAVRKSLIAMEANPNAPLPEDVCPHLFSSMTDMNMDPVATINEARTAVPDQSPSPSSDNLQSSIGNLQSSPSPSVNPVNPVNSVHSVPATPASPSIPAVPQCPTWSPENLVRTLDRTTTDLSNSGLLPAHSPTVANPQSPSPTLGARTSSSAPPATFANAPTPSPTKSPSPSPSPAPSQSISSDESVRSVSSVRSVQSALPQSEIPNLQSTICNLQSSDPPCPRANTPSAPGSPAAPRPQCTECDAELCPSRIAVPIFTGILKRTQKCDGACRFCSPKRQHNCPYTLPRFRASPIA